MPRRVQRWQGRANNHVIQDGEDKYIQQINGKRYVQSSQVKWALWQWMQALAAFFFLGPSLSLRVLRMGPVPVGEDGSVSVAVF